MKEKEKSRRDFMRWSLSTLLTMTISSPILAQDKKIQTKMIGSRLWSSRDYTRITFESNNKLNFKYFKLDSPLRLVVDVEGVEIKEELKDLAKKLIDDKYIASFRVGINRPNVSRIVFELKESINPQIFTLEPVENYSYRLVLDLYPEKNPDDFFAQIMEKEREQKYTQLVDEEKKSKNKEKNKKPEKVFVIALDAGHGGEDPGAIGANGTYEKDITLSIAKKLKEKIDNIPWLQAVLIRDDDYFIPLYKRIEKARKAKADIFISIHADAVMNREAKGSSVYVLSEKGATSATSKWLAEKENDADLIGGLNIKTNDTSLARTLLDLSLSATTIDSSKLGKFVLHAMGKINDLHKKDIEGAGFAVLKSPTIPSILVETAFISNPEEEKKLKDSEHQEKIAEAIISGISKFTGQKA
jgi:N-acetylmuramoyl-L-alanine amidase